MNFFGRRTQSPSRAPKAAAPASGGGGGGASVNNAVGNIKTTIQNMQKRQDVLEKKMKVETKKALEYKKKGNQKGALLCLKKKKMYEKEVDKITASIFNLEQQAATLESSQTTADIINTQKEFKNAMQKIQKQVNVDDVADLQDDIAEQMAIQEEVGEILGQSTALDDEDELEDELNELMMEDEEEVLVSDVGSLQVGDIPSNTIGVTTSLPTVPDTAIQQKQTEETEDDIALRELQAEMAM